MNKKFNLLIFAIFILASFTLSAQPLVSTLSSYRMKSLKVSSGTLSSIPIYDPHNVSNYYVNKEPESIINYTQDLHLRKGYLGQRPVFAHQVVTSRNGDVLFYIVDNYIYNKNGKGFMNANEGACHVLHEGYNPYHGYHINSLPKHLHNKIIVVPKPGDCDVFYIFYAFVYGENATGLQYYANLHVKEVEYINEDNISVLSTYELTQSGLSPLESVGTDFNFAITNYDPVKKDYILMEQWGGKLRFYKITNNLSTINNTSNYITYTKPYAPIPRPDYNDVVDEENEPVAEYAKGYKRADPVLFDKGGGNMIMIVPGAGNLNGSTSAYPVLTYYTFPRDFTQLKNNINLVSSKDVFYEKCYSLHPWYNTHSFRNICGMECSPNKKYLYVTFMELGGIYYFDLNDFLQGGDFPITYSALNVTGNYRYSELERFSNGKIYAVNHTGSTNFINDYGKLTSINTPNSPQTTNFSYNCFSGTSLKRMNLISLYVPQNRSEEFQRRYIFNYQLDDSNYIDNHPGTYFHIGNWATVSSTWSPGTSNNPFGSGDGKVYFNQDLVVPAGKNITINNMSLFFTQDASLYISPGASVTLNGCLLSSSSACNSDNMWPGIIVDGNNNIAQSATYHGKITVMGGSVIENAQRGISSTNGGIVCVYNAELRNNVYGIYFNRYNHTHILSYIRNSKFYTDKIFDNPSKFPIAHIYLYNVSGLSIYKNTFSNDLDYFVNSSYYVDRRGKGIQSNNSSFKTVGGLLLVQNPSNKFYNLHYGIYVSGQKNTAPNIRYNEFKDNFRGLYLSGTDGAVVVFNKFSTLNGNPPVSYYSPPCYKGLPETDVKYAAYLASSKNYKFEENTIDNGDVGLYVYNSGIAEAHAIYRNKFGENSSNKMRAATVIIGKNSDWDRNNPGLATKGLEVRCNTYTNNEIAIQIINGNMSRWQGYISNGAGNKAAHNIFNKTYINDVDFGTHIDVGYTSYDASPYFYIQNSNNVAPSGYYSELLRYNNDQVIPITYLYEYKCPANYFGGVIIERPHKYYYDMIENISYREKVILDLVYKKEKIKDLGLEEYKIAVKQLHQYGEYEKSYNILESKGFTKGDTILTALICENIKPKMSTKFIVDSYSPLPEEVLKIMYGFKVDGKIADLLLKYQDYLEQKYDIQNEINYEKGIIDMHEMDMMHDLISNDTLKEIRKIGIDYFSKKSENMRESEPEMACKAVMNIYRLNLAENDYKGAQQQLYYIEDIAEKLPEEIRKEMVMYSRINKMYILWSDTGEDKEIEKNKDMIYDAAIGESPLYAGTAQMLYNILSKDCFFYEKTPLASIKIEKKNAEVNLSGKDLYSPTLNIYPNPTKDIIYLEYDLSISENNEINSEICHSGQINIYSGEGKLIRSFNLSQVADTQRLDVEGYPSGMYIIEIVDCCGNVNMRKFIKE